MHGVSGLGTFAETMVVDEAAAVAVDTDLPADQLSVVGCAVLTGTGAALNTADLQPGQTVAVIGAGGIGLAAIQGARIRNAGAIVAIDPSEAARAAALTVGATHVFESGAAAADTIGALTAGRGVDTAFDCVGRPTTLEAAWPLVRKGGDLVVIGVPVAGDHNPIPMVELVRNAKRIVGVMYGSSSMHRDIPLFVRLAETGQLDLGALIGDHVDIEGMHGVLCGGHHGAGRTVIDWPS
ncbi:MAG: zinc-binding dehydrogenase [Acidimicrobiales bacterium]